MTTDRAGRDRPDPDGPAGVESSATSEGTASPQELAELVVAAAHRVRRRSLNALAPLGLTPAQERALRLITRAEHGHLHDHADPRGNHRGGGRRPRGSDRPDPAAPGVPLSSPPPGVADAGSPSGVLESAPGIRMGELAERMGIVPRSATDLVDALEAAGLVQRRPDPSNRRIVRVTLAERGREVQRGIAAARQAGAAEMFGRLGPRQRQQLAGLLAQVCRADDDHPAGAAWHDGRRE